MTNKPRFGPARTGPTADNGSIDIQQRLAEIEKQRRIILEATDDERLARCMRVLGCDLVATQRDFRRANELEWSA